MKENPIEKLPEPIAGKGSKRRDSFKNFSENYDLIDWAAKKKLVDKIEQNKDNK